MHADHCFRAGHFCHTSCHHPLELLEHSDQPDVFNREEDSSAVVLVTNFKSKLHASCYLHRWIDWRLQFNYDNANNDKAPMLLYVGWGLIRAERVASKAIWSLPTPCFWILEILVSTLSVKTTVVFGKSLSF